jgi:hypothetical protein
VGDSNLNIDLPFGVQTLAVSEVFIHENFKPDSASGDANNIGLIRMTEPALMTKTVCLLCLPEEDEAMGEKNCTAVSYGKRVEKPKAEGGEDGSYRGELTYLR